MRNRGSGLLDLIRIKMKNLLEVSEIVDNSIIHEYLSRIGNTKPPVGTRRGRRAVFENSGYFFFLLPASAIAA